MLPYIARRILQGAVVVVLISVITFVVIRLMPGDPAFLLLGEGEIRISAEQMEGIRKRWGLDRPYHEQYLVWAWNLLRGDFGDSLIRTGIPVRQMIFEAIPVTARLNVISLALALAVAIPAGIVAGVRRNSPFDYGTAVGSTLGVALPNFWLGLMLIVLFALYVPRWFGELPLIGRVPPFGLRSWQGYILPVLVLTTEQMAVLTRVMRASTLEVLGQDYVRTAYAKGLPNTVVLVRHAVRNALLPVVTVIGFRIAFILSGTIVVETVFALPGIGRLFTDSVFRLDYQVVQSLVVVLAVLVVAVNLLTDLTYAIIDPRIRIG
ncbi:MAG: ABC transporter permease [Caldilineaceae bacterium]|nr:ABC transporter permease [Caldilineaceae bacterium]MDE0071555.1 ABC transporter permease [Caldilineaceae bacterium]MDE0182483.1 ABC transporter permease [Caldilineaceae bacterium]MDE0430786.1 ABC transporter permease [Caldilineaceae bacterium]